MIGENKRETALNMLRSINSMFLAGLFFICSSLLYIAFTSTLHTNGAFRQAKHMPGHEDV